MEETDLRTRLEELAWHSAPPPRNVDDLTATLAERHRAGRRRQYALAAVVAVVVTVVAVVPAVRSALHRDSSPAAPSGPVDVYSGPARGSLADDADFLDDLRRLPWVAGEAAYPAPPAADRHVVWAADLDGARWAVVVGDNGLAERTPLDGPLQASGRPGTRGTVAVAWFLGPVGADAELMTLAGLHYAVSPAMPTALSDLASATTVIIGGPDDRIEVSPRPWVVADANVRRSYEVVPAQDGVAVLIDDDEAPTASSLSYRVRRDRAWVTGRPGVHAGSGSEVPVREFPLAYLRPAPPSALGDGAVPGELQNVLLLTGLPADEVTFTVVWAGDVPLRSGDGSARVTLVAAKLPSSAFYVTAVVGWDAGGAELRSRPCGSELRPANPPLAEQFFVVRCSDSGGWPPDMPADSLVVVAPPGAGFAQAWHDDDDLLGGFPLTDGVAVVPAPEQTFTIEILDSEYGHILDRRAPMSVADLDG